MAASKHFLHHVVDLIDTRVGEPQLNGKGLARDSWLSQEVRTETGRDNCMAGAAERGWTYRTEGEVSQLSSETTGRPAWLREIGCSVSQNWVRMLSPSSTDHLYNFWTSDLDFLNLGFLICKDNTYFLGLLTV